MGTRSLTHVKAENGDTLVTIYRHLDGYPTGIGADILRILGPRQLVNGFNDPALRCNGMECAAALLISALKGDDCGGVYVFPVDSEDCGEEYTYTISCDSDAFHLRVAAGRRVLYTGPLNLFDPEAAVFA